MNAEYKRIYRQDLIDIRERVRDALVVIKRFTLLAPGGVIALGAPTGLGLSSDLPQTGRNIFVSAIGASLGIYSGCAIAHAIEELAKKLTVWYGYEYGQATRLMGVVAGAGCVTTGVLGACGVLTIGSGPFFPVLLISTGLTVGGICLYFWWKRRRSSACVLAMRELTDLLHSLYIRFGERIHAIWEILDYIQQDTLKIPRRIALAIMRCSSSKRRIRIFTNYLDSLY